MAPTKRNCLTVTQKLMVIDAVKQGDRREDVATQYGICVSTISKLIKKEKVLRDVALRAGNTQAKKFKPSRHDAINDAVTTWFHQMRAKNAPINGPLILAQAKKFVVQMEHDFHPSQSWLERWKTSNNVTFQRCQGEQASCDTQGAKEWMQNVLPEILARYEPVDRYNADESGLFYKALPSGTFATKGSHPTSIKMPKDRLTVLFIANQTGSCKQAHVIGKFAKPRCFTGVSSLPLPYYSNSKAWMTSSIWTIICNKFDKTLDHKIVLFIDNATCHKLNPGTLLKNIEVVFLPPNTTALIQPLDQGIIHNVKQYYRQQICRQQLIALENGFSLDQYKSSVNILKAMHMLKRALWLVKPTTVSNCFRKAGFDLAELEDVEEAVDMDNLGMDESEFAAYVMVDEGAVCHGELLDEEIVAMTTNGASSSNVEDDVDDSVPPNSINPSTALSYIDALRTFVDVNGGKEDAHAYLDGINSFVISVAGSKARQSRITDYFSH